MWLCLYKRIGFAALLLCGLSHALVVEAEVEVMVDMVPQQRMIYGMDFERLWHWKLLPEEARKLAQYAVKDCKVDYVRIAIDGAAEFNESEFDWGVYSTQLNCMNALKDANPEIKFFASPRPFREAIISKFGRKSRERLRVPFVCYPLWISEFENPYEVRRRKYIGFRWEKAADYMVRQIGFLRDQGFDVAYMDVKNEGDRFFRPLEMSLMVERMREQLGNDMPQVIAPSSYSPADAITWVEEAVAKQVIDSFDIVSSHNTKDVGSLQVLGDTARRLNKPLWNTEMHAFNGPDDRAVANSEILWSHVRSGFSGINEWLSLGGKSKTHKMFRNVDGRLEVMRVYYIFKELVNTSGGGHYLGSNIPGGLTSTAAFIRDGVLTVWLLNASDSDVAGVTVRFDERTADADSAEVVWWDAENGREGSRGMVSIKDDSSFTCDIKANSLYCFSVRMR